MGVGLPAIRELMARRRTVWEVAAEHVRALDGEIRLLRLRRALVHAFGDIPADAPGAGIAAGMRVLPPELPDEPSAEQVSAWLELAGLASDPSFAERVRDMAVAGAASAAPSAASSAPDSASALDPARMREVGRRALADGIEPRSPQAEALVRELLGEIPAADRAALADRLATFSDARVERFWALLGILNGRPPFEPMAPAVDWCIAALRAR